MWGAIAMAGAGLLKQLMEGKAARAQQEREANISAAKSRYDMESQGAQRQSEGERNALSQLMSAYRDAMLR